MPPMHIVINGNTRELTETTTVAELLGQLEIPLRGIAVEINEHLLPRTQHGTRQLADGDRLEIVSLVGGG